MTETTSIPGLTNLPITERLPELKERLSQHANTLLIAEPGAGKTTRVPLALLDEAWLATKQIIMLEPRRLAARNAAVFMSRQLGETVGQTVGYRIRLENRCSQATRILVVTEGVLTRMLQQDPELSSIGLIIFDEFHERHLHSDLALALAHQCQQLFRPDLKILLMSATLDSDRLGHLLNAPVVRCPGRGFPVTTQYRPQQNNVESLTHHCCRVIRDVLNDDNVSGDVLVFLPGTREIHAVQRQLSTSFSESSASLIDIMPLHGRLSDQEQKRVLNPAPTQIRKIILATNIAESSLTLDGVRVVIDSGWEKRLSFNPNNGLSQLNRRRISQASSVQRQGRAGRQAPGHCYRLWPEAEQTRLMPHIEPEIVQTDLSHLLLELLQWGASADELIWLTPPPSPAMAAATHLLHTLSILQDGELTRHGKQCMTLGVEPRWASALVMADRAGAAQQACELLAMLQTGFYPEKERHSATEDIDQRWLSTRAMLERSSPDTTTKQWQRQVAPLAQRWHRTLRSHALRDKAPRDAVSLDVGLFIAMAWPDRIACNRSQHIASSKEKSSRYQLSNGSGAVLATESPLAGVPFLAITDISAHTTDGHKQNRIRQAVALTHQHLEQIIQLTPTLASESITVEWQESGALLAEQRQYVGRWVWQRQRLKQLTDAQWNRAWDQWFSTSEGLASLDWNQNARQLQHRIRLITEQDDHRFADWPDVSDGGLITRRDSWLMPALTQIRHQRELKKINVSELLYHQLDWQQRQQLDALAPQYFRVASGSRIDIDYQQTPPVLAVKLQELFGYEQQPRILNGRLALMIHLLSPARRPVQITQDLPHFWKNSYLDVRKDLRGRYPRHPWPEDPLTAEATRLTSRALSRRDQ